MILFALCFSKNGLFNILCIGPLLLFFLEGLLKRFICIDTKHPQADENQEIHGVVGRTCTARLPFRREILFRVNRQGRGLDYLMRTPRWCSGAGGLVGLAMVEGLGQGCGEQEPRTSPLDNSLPSQPDTGVPSHDGGTEPGAEQRRLDQHL